jgi:hypothetical protein
MGKGKLRGKGQRALVGNFFPRKAKPLAGEDVSERLRERDSWGSKN